MAESRKRNKTDESWQEPEAFLRARGIVPDNGEFTERQLVRELTRRGWRWDIDPPTVRATKAYTTTSTVTQTFVSHNSNQLTALVSVLARAIRFDEEHGLTLTRSVPADIVIRAPDQRIVALVEVKGIRTLSDSLATHLRGNLVSYSLEYSLAPFFLLVTQEVGYLWDQREGVLPFSPATLKFSMRPIVHHYLKWLSPGEQAGSSELGLAVAEWLNDLAHPDPLRPMSRELVLQDPGFLDAIQGATALTQAAV